LVNRLSPKVTKSTGEFGETDPSIQKARYSINLNLYIKPRFSNVLGKEAGFFEFGSEMAAQGGIRDKILRVSMPFEKGRHPERKTRAIPARKRALFGNASDPRQVVRKVHSWAKQLREGRVKTRSEVAKREGITSARVSQLWPLCRITREQAELSLRESTSRAISLRTLIRFARNTGVDLADS
jgi:hypothetical protein